MVYKVLILEDNEMDASLMKQYLQRSAFDFDIKWVSAGKDYENAVESFEPDIIISDYRLKQYSGLDAIHYRNLHCEDVPIIIVSGTIGEEKAVELIKKGATDFLIKNHAAARLGQAIERAIKEAVEKEKRKRTEAKLKSSEERFRMLFEHSLDGIIIGNPDTGAVITANDAACNILGYSFNEIKNLSLGSFIDLNKKRIVRGIEKRDRDGYFRGEVDLKRKDGSLLPVEVSSRILELKSREKRSYYIIRDISDRLEWEQQIQASLKEKETLLTEIHHRVKNNLAVVSAMMEMQAMESDNEELQKKLFDSQSRIKSIALTHEMLYEEQSFSNINFSTNIRKLVNRIEDTMKTGVEYKFNLEKVRLNINQALPCSLIVNELITNALKHAFAGVEKPEVEIILKEKNGDIHLTVQDNGKGLPENILVESKSMGYTLVKILTTQLKGEICTEQNGYSKIYLKFTKADVKGTGSSIFDQ